MSTTEAQILEMTRILVDSNVILDILTEDTIAPVTLPFEIDGEFKEILPTKHSFKKSFRVW